MFGKLTYRAIEWLWILEIGPVVREITGGGGDTPQQVCDSPEPNEARVKCANNQEDM